MPGIAITDNGNMYGAMEFYKYVSRINIERKKKRNFFCDGNKYNNL